MKAFGTFLILIACVFICVSAAFGVTAYDKYSNYNNDDSNYLRSVNAYVGGDAYNYIINAGYFTAFSIISSAFGIGGLISLISGVYMIEVGCRQTGEMPTKKQIEKLDERYWKLLYEHFCTNENVDPQYNEQNVAENPDPIFASPSANASLESSSQNIFDDKRQEEMTVATRRRRTH